MIFPSPAAAAASPSNPKIGSEIASGVVQSQARTNSGDDTIVRVFCEVENISI